MKKLLLTMVCAVCALTVSAQRASSSSSTFFSTEKSDQPITVGVRVGMNISNFSGDVEDLDSRIGFNAGVIVDIPLMQSLYLQTGLFITQKGAKYNFEFEKEDGKININPLYLQIPVLASYRYDFSDAAQLQVNFGPYFAYGISGKVKVEDLGKIDFFGDDEDQFGGKRFEAGLHIGAGVTISKFYIGCAYEFGLSDAFDCKNLGGYDGEDDAFKGKNSNFMINVGYNF